MIPKPGVDFINLNRTNRDVSAYMDIQPAAQHHRERRAEPAA